jgi:soluble lytic murein transglycosylase
MYLFRRRAFALLVLAIAATACGGSKGSPPSATPVASTTPGATKTVTPVASPSPAPADLKAAARLREEGDFAPAADVYAAIAASSDGDKRQEARFAQAQLLSRAGRLDDARGVLLAYLADASGGAAPDAGSARFLLASTLDDLGDTFGALDSYEKYIAADGAATGFARVERAKLLARLGRSAEAETAAEAVLASSLLPEFKASFTLSMGKALEDGKDDVDALAWYARAQTIDGGDVASALARVGAVKKRLGDVTWSDDYLRAIAAYPSSGSAPDLLDELDAAAVHIGDYVRGVIEYRAFRNTAARASLTRAIASGDNAAEATYYIGALDERAADPASAIASYQRSYELNPVSALADDALWWRARLLELAGRYDDAATVYETLVTSFAASTWRVDADFRRGLAQYKAGNYAGAALVWSVIAAGGGDDAPRARFWQGRAQLASRDALASAVLSQLASDPDARGNFYALRAEVLLGKNDTSDKTVKLGSSPVDWTKIARFLKDATGTDPQTTDALTNDARWAIGAALEDVGLHAQSDAEYRSLLRDNKDDPPALFAIAKRLADEGRTPLAARAAVTLIGALPKAAPLTPDDLLRVAYPAAYGDLASDAAKQEGVSPLLLLSLVRQESFFDPEAGSGAGALGLTQVVPATGQQIAAKLGSTGFTASDLYRPKISLQFGASYLATQLALFDSDPYRALAAYNGGPGAASDAADAAGADDDLLLEELEFDETRSYIRLVMENLARYRQLYAGVDRPSLPR